MFRNYFLRKNAFFMFVPLLFIYGCGADHSSGDESIDAITGVYTISAHGGQGSPSLGAGGAAQGVTIEKTGGTGPINIEKTGRADATVDARSLPGFNTGPVGNLTVDLGIAGRISNFDETITFLDTADPSASPPDVDILFYGIDGNVYRSNGDDKFDGGDTLITGWYVQEDITVTLELNYDSTDTDFNFASFLNFTDDVDIHGTIVTEDTSWNHRGGVWIKADNMYVHDNGILKTTMSDTSTVRSGDISIELTGNFYNRGTLDSSGNFGNVVVQANSIENYGTLLSFGVDSDTTQGGGGGNIDLIATNGLATGESYIWNNGIIDTYGGDSTISYGADGGYVYFLIQDTTSFSQIKNAGNINTYGGFGAGGLGGDGGWFGMQNYGNGGIYSNANISTYGGSTSESVSAGGAGGDVYIYSENAWQGFGLSSFGSVASNIEISGNINAYGGNSASVVGLGGIGGYIDIYLDGDSATGFANYSSNLDELSINLLGYKLIDSSGATGYGGGGGGDIIVFNNNGITGGVKPGGSITNQAALKTTGGGVLPSITDSDLQGGDAGDVYLYTESTYGASVPLLQIVTNTGQVEMSGGTNIDTLSQGAGGSAGTLDIIGYNGITNEGDIIGNGGADIKEDHYIDGGKIDGFGDDGGLVSMVSALGEALNSGDITMNGGKGEYDAGRGGIVYIFGDKKASNTGDITVTGAEAIINAGGDGGCVEIDSTVATDATNSGTVEYLAGSGAISGLIGGMKIGDNITDGTACSF